jgi:hypothetical protein
MNGEKVIIGERVKTRESSVRVFGMSPRIEVLTCRKQLQSDNATTCREDALEMDFKEKCYEDLSWIKMSVQGHV